MKNEATRSSLEKTDRAVVENMKNLAQLMGAIRKASDAYRAADCHKVAAVYEGMLPAIDGLLEAFDRANIAAVMAHKNLAGVGVPAPAQQDEIPAFMVGQQMEMD